MFYPVQLLADWLTYAIFNISPKTLLGNAVDFFIFDTIKIFILLSVIIFIVSIIRSYLPPEKIRSILSHKNKYVGNVLASFLGIITPFCSCSAIPLFLGFVQAGVPLGTTFSFLIASPMINEVALVLLLGLFGWKIALIYIASGLIIAILSGAIIGELRVENLVEDFSAMTKADIDNAPVFKVAASNIDLGKIKGSTQNEVEFKFTNAGKNDLIIRNVKSTCGCTVAEQGIVGVGIKAGTSSSIKATFNSGGYSGKVTKLIYVYTNDPKNSEIVLQLNADVEQPPQAAK